MQRQTPKLKSEKDCTGCGACIVSCSKGAITKKSVGMGAFSLPSEKELNELGKTKTAEIRQFLI